MLADSLEAACRAIFMVEAADEMKIKNVFEEIFNGHNYFNSECNYC